MTDNSQTGDRIAKVMARAGVASRRDAERMIVEGRVAVNGQTVTSPALDVLPTDRVTLDGKPIDAPQPARLWLYYKPLGLVTSEKDEKGRQTVFESLPDGLPRVMSVGRLDLNSEGLLLLTNDGGLKRRLELPSTGWLRKYRVRVNGRPNEATFDPLRRGVTIDGEDFLPMDISMDRQQGANAWLTVGLREGRNREIRRAMAEVGLTVNRLIRVSYGPFRLNEMKPGDVVEVKQKVLKEQLGDSTRQRRDERPARDGGGERPRGPRREGSAPERRPRGAPGGDFPRKPRAEGAGGFDRKPRPPRAEGSEGHERKPRHARSEGAPRRRPDDAGAAGRDRKPRPQGAEGYERKPRAPRRESGAYDRKPRTPRAEGGESRPPKPYARRADPSDGHARKSYSPRGEGAGDREHKPRVKRTLVADDPTRKPRAPRGAAAGGFDRKPRAGSGAEPTGGQDRKPRAAGGPGAARGPRKGGAGAARGPKGPATNRPDRPDRAGRGPRPPHGGKGKPGRK